MRSGIYRWLWALAVSIFSLVIAGWSEPDWRQGAEVPEEGRSNIYQLSQQELPKVLRRGRLHSLHYPVTVSGITLPYQATQNFLSEDDDEGGLRSLLKRLFKGLKSLNEFDDIEQWLGLHRYPERETSSVPFKGGVSPQHRMGLTVMQQQQREVFTLSCAQCHSANLFGQQVIGMTNRFRRANEAFLFGSQAMRLVTPGQFQWVTNASDEDTATYRRSRRNMRYVEAKRPVQVGLDTSLAQVSLSLSRREQDEYASKNFWRAQFPRTEKLRSFVADSKPAVWWTLKYKNRWLSDGSVVSGNPIYTNFLWNEIGRGTDLKQLEQWLNENDQTVRELTAAVFATEAPSYFDFFEASTFDIESAKKGQVHFNQMCSRCHGVYIKGWQAPGGQSLPIAKQLATTQVMYPRNTQVVDVGTDPNRYLGMSSLEQLNDLKISKNNGIRIERQLGYVPPPLVGIWARWPYMHNNSIPTLCDVLSPWQQRPKKFFVGEAHNKNRDFDRDCNGYPRPAPDKWRKQTRLFDTSLAGSSRRGHDQGIFLRNGQTVLNETMKRELIRYLQTL